MEIHCASGESSYRPLTFTYAADRIYNENEVFERTETVRLPQYFIQTDDVDILYKRGRFISSESGEGSLMLPNYPNYMKVNSGLMFHKYDSGYDPLQRILLIPSFSGNPSSIDLLTGYGFQTIEAVDTDGDGTDELVKVNNTCTARNVTSFTIEVCTVEHDEIVGTGQLEFNVHDGTHNLLYNNPAQCDYYFGDFRGNGREMLLIVTRPGSHFVLVDLDTRTVNESTLFAVDNDTPRWIFIADLEGRIVDADHDAQHIGPQIDAIRLDAGIQIHDPMAGDAAVEDLIGAGRFVIQLCTDQRDVSGSPHGIAAGLDLLRRRMADFRHDLAHGANLLRAQGVGDGVAGKQNAFAHFIPSQP